MKKNVFKALSILILASLVISCSGGGGESSSGGPSNVPKNNLQDQISKEKEALLVDSGLTNLQKNVYAPTFNPGDKDLFIEKEKLNDVTGEKEPVTVIFDEKLTNQLASKDKKIKFKEGSQVQFKANNPEIPELDRLENHGNMYFVDKTEKPVEYVLKFNENKSLYNYSESKIFVMDGNQGSTLKIDGNFRKSSTIMLGLYVDRDNNLTTDKIHITGNINGDTSKIKFIYNKEMLKAGQSTDTGKFPTPTKDHYVIKVDGNVDSSENFTAESESIPYGTGVYEFKYHEKTEEVGSSHIWKLEKRN